MKIALCFIISYDHILNKEDIWRKWIEPNKDIINIYFYYKDLKLIKSKWILEHTIPSSCIYNTTYYHVIPAYMSILSFAYNNDSKNQWFCLLTDSCCPIIPPKKFRELFFENYNKSIMNWKKAWWNINFHKRANLAILPKELHLANDPWFLLKREHVNSCIQFVKLKPDFVTNICKGGLANESLFAIILYYCKQLQNTEEVLKQSTHISDWSRMSSVTSPHVFKYGDERDLDFIYKELKKNKYSMFIRKVDKDFPNQILNNIIYSENSNNNEKNIFNKISNSHKLYKFNIVIIIVSFYILYLFLL